MEARSRHFVLAAVLLIALGLGLLPGCAQEKQADTGGEETAKETYKIGAVLSLTGTYSGLGQPEKNTIEMEVERINAAGGVHGRDIEVIVEDDATEPAQAVTATSRLIQQEKVIALIGATGTGQTMGMRGDVDKAGIPQVSCAGGTVITQQFDPLVFQTPWSNTIVVPFELKYMQGKDIKKVAMISDSGGFGKDGHDVVKAELPNFGMELVADEVFNAGDTDMTSQLTKIKASKPDAVLMVSAGKEAVIVAQNMQQLKMDTPLYGTHGNARAEFISGAADAAEGFRFAAGKILKPEEYGTDTESYKVASDFVKRYTDKYGKAPDTFAGHAYDSLYLIVEAMKRAPEGFTSAQLRDEIEATDGFVGIGGVFKYSAEDHNGLSEKDLVMYEVKGGEWIVVK